WRLCIIGLLDGEAPPRGQCLPGGAGEREKSVGREVGFRRSSRPAIPMTTVADLVAWLERFAPPPLAADWDNVGLLLGDRKGAVRRIMTCLTVTPESAAEAVDSGSQLIVTHHPVLFRSVKRLTTDTSEGRMLLSLIAAGVAVYSPHTAFDNTKGGINAMLAGRLGLEKLEWLRPIEGSKQCKLVVFVPAAGLARVSDAL